MNKVWTPNQKKKEDELVRTQFIIDFSFSEYESFDAILDKLDATLNKERQKAVEALAKFKKIKINWDKN